MTTTMTMRTSIIGIQTMFLLVVFGVLFSSSVQAFPSLLSTTSMRRPSSSSTTAAALLLATTSTTTSNDRKTNMALGMFTGIVEEIGTVISLDQRNDMTLWDGSVGTGTELTIQADVVLDGAYLGCSICVSGVCLTATQLLNGNTAFKVGLAPETLAKTYFGTLHQGQKVNLERASEIGGRNSGHFVQGHVDCTGTIVDKRPEGDSLWFTVKVDDPALVKYIVPKGFIAIDGTSLTVVDVNPSQGTFTFMLVEYTQKKIVQPSKQIGEKVNLEVDVLGKYSETALAALMPRLESLEAKVETLEKKLAAVSGGVAGGSGVGVEGQGVNTIISGGSGGFGRPTSTSFGNAPTTSSVGRPTTSSSTPKVAPMRPGQPDGPLNTNADWAKENARRSDRIQTQNEILGYEPAGPRPSESRRSRIGRQVLGSNLNGHTDYINPPASRGNMFAAGSGGGNEEEASAARPSPPRTDTGSSSAKSQQDSAAGRPDISAEPPIFQSSSNKKFASVPSQKDTKSNQEMRPDPFL